MTEIITGGSVLLLGGIACFLFLSLLRVLKYGPKMADTTIRSGFGAREWLTGLLPEPSAHASYLTTSGIRASAGRKGLVIIPTRTLSRLEF